MDDYRDMDEAEHKAELKAERVKGFELGFMAGVDEYASDELTIGEISEALAEAKRIRL